MSTEKKFELLTHARESIFNPSAERSKWLGPESLKLTINGFHVDKRAGFEGTLNFTIDNRSGSDLGIGVLTNAATAAGCSGYMVSTGLPPVAPARDVAFSSGTIPMTALLKASDPARLLRWFPAGGRLSATIQWNSCSTGMQSASRSIAVNVPVVLAKGRDVLELSLSSDQR